ncbi:DUF1232 domain-containing protein [Brevibacillus daliensis]|uniref:DUF1232 domain-containing protein n=1 Tax=Brevibacillus daliensis TaxID=2892995 RepID=UPI001E47597C|nr:DUF1232 domain-containing protein [Brevibacillus daliensis]
MILDNRDTNLGSLIKTVLKERSLSMRKLSVLTGIDTATISRIVNGKQRPKHEHLQQFAYHLSVPLDKLFQAAGIDLGLGKPPIDDHTGIHSSIDTIQEILASSDYFDHQFTTERVQAELVKYERYALTEEGKQAIVKGFPVKIEQVSGAGPFIEQLRFMYEEYCIENVEMTRRALLGSALLYFVLSTDIIPDYIFPIGYLDDAIAVQLVVKRLSQMDNSIQSNKEI